MPPPDPEEPQPALWRRLLWFAGLAITASSATALVAYALRALPFGAAG